MLRRKVIFLCMFVLSSCLAGCGASDNGKAQTISEQDNTGNQSEAALVSEAEEEQKPDIETEHQTETEAEVMRIKVASKEYEIVFELNESQAAKDLYAQLPLNLEVKDFSTNEKTFYPPEELRVNDTPMANAEKGSLCYYSPWADVVMFYDDFGQGSSLYALGKVVSGKDDIEKLTGMIEITAVA